jgi:hypothetical protein
MAHRMSSDDLWSLKALGDIALSPDGRRVAFVTQSCFTSPIRRRTGAAAPFRCCTWMSMGMHWANPAN